MIVSQAYQLQQQIYRTEYSAAYLALKNDDLKTVLIRLPLAGKDADRARREIKREFKIIKKFDFPGKLEFQEIYLSDGTYLLEVSAGKLLTLRKHLQQRKLSQKAFLDIAVDLTDNLSRLHDQDIILGCCYPESIFLEDQENRVKFSDFSRAAKIVTTRTEDKQIFIFTNSFQVFLYLSPEQTGCLNGPVDRRSDLYSLGVLFYEMLTGCLPVEGRTPLELFHALTAGKVIPPRRVNAQVPEALSVIVMKLLSRDPDNRYQSSYGLKKDLQRCLDEWKKRKSISCFTPARHDIPVVLRVSEKYHGREQELQSLQKTLKRVGSCRSEIIMLAGEAGIGKTRLVQQFQEQVQNSPGFFTVGKFNTLKSDVPYEPLVQAFRQLFGWIMSRSREDVITWKKKLQEKLGTDISYLAEIMPYIEQLLNTGGRFPRVPLQETRGNRPPVFSMEIEESFHYAFYSLVQLFAKKKEPLVIFLDDLQWADSGTLRIIETLFTKFDVQHFLLIGAYRQEEVAEDHPLKQTTAKINQSGIKMQTIKLEPVTLRELSELTADSLGCKRSEAEPLARFFLEKTGGNPLFVKELVRSMFKNKLITHNPGGGWQWDLDKIKHAEFAGDLVNFLVEKVRSLPQASLDLLRFAACIGNTFDSDLLAKISNLPFAPVEENLLPCINEGLIQKREEVYNFVHDRIHQAVYLLVPDEEKPSIHYRLAYLILEDKNNEQLCTKANRADLFKAVNHLNLGMEVTMKHGDKVRGAQLNLLAAKMAKQTAAFFSALQYLKMGLALLDENLRHSHYRLLVEINLEYLECLYLCDYYLEGDRLYQGLIQTVKDKPDRVKLRSVKALYYTKKNFDWEAVRVGLNGLRELGYNIPEKPSTIYIGRELLKVRLLLQKVGIDRVEGLEPASDPEKKAAMDLLIVLGPCAYNLDDDFLFAVSLKVCELSLRYGNFSNSCTGYMMLAMVYVVQMKNFKWGEPLGKIAVRLAERNGTDNDKCTVNFLYGAFYLSWLEHTGRSEIYLTRAKEYGLAASDLTFAGYALIFEVISMHFRGVPLQELDDRIDNNMQYSSRINDPCYVHTLMVYKQLVRNLQGLTSEAGSFNDNSISEKDFLISFRGMKVRERDKFDYYLLKGQVDYLLGCYNRALSSLKEADLLAKLYFGEIYLADLDFYYCLTILARYHRFAFKEKVRYRLQLLKKYRRLRGWARRCAANFEHKYLLIAAETARVKGKDKKAFYLYEQAISSAKRDHYSQNAAIACECAAGFCFSRDLTGTGKKYLHDALEGYRGWGATIKVRQLEEQYPWLVKDENRQDAAAVEAASAMDEAQNLTQMVDVEAIFRATRILSREIVLEDLLAKMMEIVLQNAGAERGALLFKEDEGLYVKVAAEIEAKQKRITALQSVPLEKSEQLPRSVVNYVARSAEIIVLDHAARKGMFADDPYIMDRQPASVLCLPMIQQNKVAGVLYMENSGTAGCFDSARVETLRLLSAQMAVSMENAGLYKQLQRLNVTLEDKVKERTAELAEFQKETAEALMEQSRLQERNRIAREIHDTVGHTLTSVLIQIEAGKRLLAKSSDLALEKLELSLNQVRKGLNEVRKSVRLLGESGSQDEMLHIEEFLQEIMKNTGISVKYHISEELKLNPAQRHVIYRALQEGITNGVRHGGSRSFKFSITENNDALKFILKDFGKGTNEVRFGFGLKSMQERVRELDGALEVRSQAGEGWSIIITVPLSKNN